MRIALISDALTVGGAERQILLSALELRKLGHTVKLIFYHPYVEFQDYIRQNNIDLVQITPKGLLRFGRIRALAGYLRESNFDVVHAFKGCSTISGALAARLAGVKRVFGGYRVEYREGRKFRVAHKFVDKLLAGWIVNSKGIADSMVAALGIDPQRFFVVYNGICPESFQTRLEKGEAKRKLEIDESTPVVSKFARLHPQKNHRLFLQMAHRILQSHPHVRFLIVGDGALRGDLQNWAESLGISANVSFLGLRTDIPDVLAATDVSVLTSDFEGFPNALIEAMSVGIAVVSTDYPSIHELIVHGKHGFIVRRNDAAAVAAKVTELLNDSDLRARMGKEGMEMVRERLSAEAMARNLVAVYQQAYDR